MSYEPQFDDMFFAVLNHVGGIDRFLDVVFSFLCRRTDFYVVKKSSAEKYGFPPGVTQKMVKVINQRYAKLAIAARANSTKPKQSNAEGADTENAGETSKYEVAVQDVEKNDSTLQDHDMPKQNNSSMGCEESLQKDVIHAEEKTGKAASEVEGIPEKAASEVEGIPEKAASEVEGIPEKAASEVEGIPEKAASEVEGIPEKADSVVEEKPVNSAESSDPERRYYDAPPECYNGASYDNYSWAQDIYVLDVQVKVPKGVKKGDQVKVDIKKNHLRVEVLQAEKWQVLLDGTLLYDLKIGGLTWTLHPDDHVHVQLEKGYERYWEALLEGEPKLNVRAIDCSKPYEDLAEEEQAKLQEMMFDQHQKMLGKPTSKQIKVQEMLKNAMKTDSPFQGQEFNPNFLNFAD